MKTSSGEWTKGVAWRVLHLVCRATMRFVLHTRIEGLEYIPSSGPVVIACRHFHHVYDGCMLLGAIQRPLRLLVALDWIPYRPMRVLLEGVNRLAGWPAILRVDAMRDNRGSVYDPGESSRYLRAAVHDLILILRSGGLVVIFPEAYPNIDPIFTPKRHPEEMLRFRAGLPRLVEWAQRDGQTRVAIVPVGLHYLRAHPWQITMRCGPPLFHTDPSERAALLQGLETQVRNLSAPA